MAIDGEDNLAAGGDMQLMATATATTQTTQRRQRLHVFGYEIGAGGGNGKGSIGCALHGTALMESQRNRGPREDSGGVERRRP
ncbi:unnamed protein product [Linum trigynum]|uniref:Uncharacterized protein n=1 Tax=Linum trigynum TaxID=586398 RepID=A0AAV2CGD7_9ROSI